MAKEYIEREAVKFAYEMSLKNDTHRTEEASRIHAQEHRRILHLLDNIPAADVVEVKHGRWVLNEHGQMFCCACGEFPELAIEKPYCPNCGAKMDGGDSDD